MQVISLFVVLLALAAQNGHGYVHRSPTGYAARYSSSATTDTECCQLNAWYYRNMDEVGQFSRRLREAYNAIAQGKNLRYGASFDTLWTDPIFDLTGKTEAELNDLVRRTAEEIVSQQRLDTNYLNTVYKPTFFDWKATQVLQQLVREFDNADFQGQQQQPLNVQFQQPLDLTQFDEVKNYAYPTEIKVLDGRTYVVHKNCTEAIKNSGTGSYESPLTKVFQRNRTIVTTNTVPAYTNYAGYGVANTGANSASLVSAGYPATYVQPAGGSTTTVRRTYHNYRNEPGVIGYAPVINANSEWNSHLNSYRPPVHIPVTGVSSLPADVETFGAYRPPSYPGSTVTLHSYNKTTIRRPDGSNVVQGAEVNRKWIDGKLVYDTQRPFGDATVPRDEAWKREERERLYWFLAPGSNTVQQLEEWQRQQEERLLAMAQRYHLALEDIQDWHRKELERYQQLSRQYQAQTQDVLNWQRAERGRLDWLIHQNSVTREEFERWQRENQDKLARLAQRYQLSLEQLKNWQLEELNRLYAYFNEQNKSMVSTDALVQNSEQERLDALIRQHNATIEQLHNSIKTDQQKLIELSKSYRGNVQDMENWLKQELAKLSGVINQQRDEVQRTTEWQRAERQRLENVLKQHRGSIAELDAQIARDRNYIQSLAAKYHVSIDELERWQRAELERLQIDSQSKFEKGLQEWQQREREYLINIIRKNDLTIDELQATILNDRTRLENLANTYKLQVSEVEDWIQKEIKNFQSKGLLKEVEKELALWQQKERERLLAIVGKNQVTMEELERRIKNDQSHMYALANKYQVHVSEIEEWLKKEMLRLQAEGLIKVEDLKDWQKTERDQIMQLVQQNKLTIEEFERKLLADRQRLQDLSKTYNVQTSEIESWIRKEGERLQNLGLLQLQEHLKNWQQLERERLLQLISQNNLSIEELQQKIKNDQAHLYQVAHTHQLRVEEVEDWIKQEIQKLQQQGLIEMSQLKDWQTEWRGNLTNMVKERDFTVEEFKKWVLEDRARLQALAMQHNVQIEEIENWVRNEEQRFVSMGLLKPYEKLTDWQEIERRYLERITQERYHSTEQLEQRLRQDRELLEQLARQYSLQVSEVEEWMKKELARLRDDGQLQIDNLTAWQIAERERLEKLLKENEAWSVAEFEQLLRDDREHMQKTAFQYHTSIEEIEKWLQSEVNRLQQQGKLNIQQLTAWQKAEQDRILSLLQRQSNITVEEFERKVQQDRSFLYNLANQYHVNVVEIEDYVKKVIEDLRQKGKFEMDNLQAWQVVERDYIKQLLTQYNNNLSTVEFEQKLLSDRAHLQQLADLHSVNVAQIEKWMIDELKRLRNESQNQVKQLSAWQMAEAQRLRDMLAQNHHVTYVTFEVELQKERQRLQQLAQQYSLNVEEIEQWLRQQLLNLKTSGQIQVENLTQWQVGEQKRLIDLLLQRQNNLSYEQFEQQLRKDRAHLQQLSQEHAISIEQIERWMRDELQRLKNSGLLQVEQLTQWQRTERQRLENWLRQQSNNASYQEFQNFLQRDKQRLQRIAQDYHVTVEEIESWVEQEGARLQLLGLVKRPEKLVTTEEIETWHHQSNHGITQPTLWQQQVRNHLQMSAMTKPMSWQEFEQYLEERNSKWQNFAMPYGIRVEDIKAYLRQVANNELKPQGFITGSLTVEEWQLNEQSYIEQLINDYLRQRGQHLSIEDLELQLQQDRQRLQQLALQYHISIEELENWYRQELQRLLALRKIVRENLADWQRREKQRIHWIVRQQPNVTLEIMEKYMLQNVNELNRLADEYHISIVELEAFIRKELQHLRDLGWLQQQSTTSHTNDWHSQERARLRAIAAELRITEEEFLQFIASDKDFQRQLVDYYRCLPEELAPFQRIEIFKMRDEGLLDKTQLLPVEPWQELERNRLYNFIATKDFSRSDLEDWHRGNGSLLAGIAQQRGISVQTLMDWQKQEFERLLRLTQYYKVSRLRQLQDFRDRELEHITFVMHQKLLTELERQQHAAAEQKRLLKLQQTTQLSGETLLAWRRRLYLLAQGRLPFDFGGSGGHEIGHGSTNFTAPPKQIISKDRGDQPPNVYEEQVNAAEPGVAGQEIATTPAAVPAQVVELSTRRPSNAYLPAVPVQGGNVQSGYRYSKKQLTYNVPVGGVASASATGGVNSASARASVASGVQMPYAPNYSNLESLSHTRSNAQQQLKHEEEDLGQQQQLDLGWQADDDQQQVEEYNNAAASRGGRYAADQQQQQQIEDYGQQQVQVEDLDGTYTDNRQLAAATAAESPVYAPTTVEVQTQPESRGFFGKIKDKIFG